jgi:hypothetical protein
MATSGTYTFNPSLGELTIYAFNLCDIRATALLQEHMESARMATNMMLANWANRGVNLWAVDLQTVNLVQGQSVYTVPDNTVVLLDAYCTITTGANPIDRVILPISRTEYASYPNKEQQGFPTVFWFDRLAPASRSTGSAGPSVTIWPVPDGTSAQTMSYYRVRQLQDSNLAGGQTVEIPYLWLEAAAYGLAQRLALQYNPAKLEFLKPLADEAYQIAAEQNVETAQQYISPQIQGYFR